MARFGRFDRVCNRLCKQCRRGRDLSNSGVCFACRQKSRPIVPRGIEAALIMFATRVRAGESRIALLIEYAELQFPLRGTASHFRKQFDSQLCHRQKLGRICFACGGPGQCRHHIVQIQHGGHNGPQNIVTLCHGCHEQIHPWLGDQSRFDSSRNDTNNGFEARFDSINRVAGHERNGRVRDSEPDAKNPGNATVVDPSRERQRPGSSGTG